MTPEVELLFHELADTDPHTRKRYYTVHSIDETIRQEVESLLAYDQPLSAEECLLSITRAVESARAELIDPPPGRCGSYELRELLGSGGMGSVYRAERIDGEVRHHVAIKLMHNRPGDLLQRQRFLQERQILASLNHANIAALLDAGHTGNGQPYCVLELVEGKHIDEYCEQLLLRQKIELFLKVCDAVSFAHSRLIVHRDLKPSNILVTTTGEPKLLDFGIAKMLDFAADETLTAARMMTPAYSSPEQVVGGAITTAADIYSLGAVLYRILTGRPPHELRNLGPESIIATISQRDVVRSSKWNPELAGDLDAILMKALRKEAQQRYATVEQFAEDLRSYLQLRPVRARQGEFLYHAGKFARRYWMPITAGFVTVAALSSGLIVALHERQIAEHRFRTVRELANNLFEVENRVRSLHGSTEARAYIADTALQYLNQLSGEANDFDLLLELSEAYERTAEVLSNRSESSLGRDDDAMTALERGYRLLQKAEALRPGDRQVQRALIGNRTKVLWLETDKGKPETVKLLASDLAKLTEEFTAGRLMSADLSLAAQSYASIRRALSKLNETGDSRYSRLAVDYSRRYAEASQDPEAFLQYSKALRQYATFLRYDGQLQQALTTFREALQALDKVPEGKKKQIELSVTLYYIGMVNAEPDWLGLGRPDIAIPALEQSSKISRELMDADPKDHNARIDFVQSTVQQAQIVQRTNPAKALPLYDQAWEIIRAEPAGSFLRSDYMIRIAGESAIDLVQLGRTDEAAQRLAQAKRMFFADQELKSIPVRTTSSEEALIRAEAEIDAATGNPRGAIAIYRQLLRQFEAGSDYHPQDFLRDGLVLSQKQARLAQLLWQVHDPAAADFYARQRLTLWQQWNQRLPNNPFVLQQLSLAQKQLRADSFQ